MIKTHQLKILPQYFEAQLSGKKNFEFRKNDRDYEVGDELVLHEIHPASMGEPVNYTGRSLTVVVTYILGGHDFEGLQPDHLIMGTSFISESASYE